jgi:hypothetical protein
VSFFVFVLIVVSFPSYFLSSLSLENLQQILSLQAFQKEKSLVAQGDVARLTKENLEVNRCQMVKVKGFVHSKLTTSN